MIKKNKQLAELVGIILGDGSFYVKLPMAELDIAFNIYEEDYIKYVKNLLESIIKTKVYKKYQIKQHCLHLRICKRTIVLALLKVSIIKPGSKIIKKVKIPKWILSKKDLLKYCLRGLIDTDGSVFRMSQKDANRARISFKNKNNFLLNQVRNSFIKLGFHPSNITYNQIFLSRKEDIRRYCNEIGFSNKKHRDKIKLIAL